MWRYGIGLQSVGARVPNLVQKCIVRMKVSSVGLQIRPRRLECYFQADICYGNVDGKGGDGE